MRALGGQGTDDVDDVIDGVIVDDPRLASLHRHTVVTI
jgi:hypothetical protein